MTTHHIRAQPESDQEPGESNLFFHSRKAMTGVPTKARLNPLILDLLFEPRLPELEEC